MSDLQEASPPRPVWLWPNLLSLDAPIIAVLWLHLFAVCGRVPIPPIATLTLGLVVWLIYAADRMLDGVRSTSTAELSPRHLFHRAHRRLLLPVLAGVLALTTCLCLQLDSQTLLFGALLMLAVVGYFLMVHRVGRSWGYRFPKEVAVAVGFGVGTFLPAWIQARELSSAMAVSLALFVTICWLNVVLIEYAEWVGLRGLRTETPDRSTIGGGKHLLAISLFTAAVALGLMRATRFRAGHSVLLAIALSALALAGLGSYWRKLSTNAVRVLADATLLTPAFVLFFVHR